MSILLDLVALWHCFEFILKYKQKIFLSISWIFVLFCSYDYSGYGRSTGKVSNSFSHTNYQIFVWIMFLSKWI